MAAPNIDDTEFMAKATETAWEKVRFEKPEVAWAKVAEAAEAAKVAEADLAFAKADLACAKAEAEAIKHVELLKTAEFELTAVHATCQKYENYSDQNPRDEEAKYEFEESMDSVDRGKDWWVKMSIRAESTKSFWILAFWARIAWARAADAARAMAMARNKAAEARAEIIASVKNTEIAFAAKFACAEIVKAVEAMDAARAIKAALKEAGVTGPLDAALATLKSFEVAQTAEDKAKAASTEADAEAIAAERAALVAWEEATKADAMIASARAEAATAEEARIAEQLARRSSRKK